jgi:hypothetical protein
MKSRKIIVDIIVILFIVLWAYAAFSKLIDYQTFKVQLGKSPLITNYAAAAAIGVPLIELAITGMLLFERTKTAGLYASLSLMLMFTTYLIVILNYSYYIPCSCGGILGNGLSWKAHVVFNLVFVILGFLGIRTQNIIHFMRLKKAYL